jgi:hypothetical protein
MNSDPSLLGIYADDFSELDAKEYGLIPYAFV